MIKWHQIDQCIDYGKGEPFTKSAPQRQANSYMCMVFGNKEDEREKPASHYENQENINKKGAK
jgi:hypothetical protein